VRGCLPRRGPIQLVLGGQQRGTDDRAGFRCQARQSLSIAAREDVTEVTPVSNTADNPAAAGVMRI